MSDDNVKVAVRVRPFNKREVERGSKLCLEMSGNTTSITDPETGKTRDFAFDYSYWSHDNFKEEADGSLVPTGSKYADQDRVFNDLGQGVLKNAFEGFNTSLFAYGQTGSGKSYSMVGYGVNRGIVPITCEELFRRIAESEGDPSASIRYKVTLSMLEIYNEQIRDLLQPASAGKKGGLAIREDVKEGKFVVRDLKSVPVHSYKEIEQQMATGTHNRTVASTQMNSTSSRAHTIITIMFEQIYKNDMGEDTTKRSEINLVDLAGSERANSTGATGARLKEGSNINRSLSTLGNVIAALAEGGKKAKHVPYRDSTLTKLLKNALGGNSKTVMIAALSPADINFEETLSTLRYADRAKQIKNSAVVNESPTDKLIRELREQVELLQLQMKGELPPAMLAAGGGAGGSGAGGGAVNMDALRSQMEAEIRAEMERVQEEMRFQNNTEEAGEASMGGGKTTLELEKERGQTTPHFTNLNEDPALTRVVRYFADKDSVLVGKTAKGADAELAEEAPAVPLAGLSIRPKHALVTKDADGTFHIEPASAAAETKLNGQPLKEKKPLLHNDRVLFGSNNLFVFLNPVNTAMAEGSPEEVSWDFAQDELTRASGFGAGGSGDPEEDLRMEKIKELLPMVNEVNAISAELDKHRTFEVALVSRALLHNTTVADVGNDKGSEVTVRVKNADNGNEWILERGEFVDMRFRIQEMYQDWGFDENPELQGPPLQDSDPFYLLPSETVVGVASVFVKFLAHGLDMEEDFDIVDAAAQPQGKLSVAAAPCDAEGNLLGEDFYIDDPGELIEAKKPYYVKFTVKGADIKQAKFANALRVRVHFGDYGSCTTEWVTNAAAPRFDHVHIFKLDPVTMGTIEFLETRAVKAVVVSRHKEDSNRRLSGQLSSQGSSALPSSKPSKNKSAAQAAPSLPAVDEAAAAKERERVAQAEAETKRKADAAEAAEAEARATRDAMQKAISNADASTAELREALKKAEAANAKLQEERDQARAAAASAEAEARTAKAQTEAIANTCKEWASSGDHDFAGLWNQVAAQAFAGQKMPKLQPSKRPAASSGGGGGGGGDDEGGEPPKSGACVVM